MLSLVGGVYFKVIWFGEGSLVRDGVCVVVRVRLSVGMGYVYCEGIIGYVGVWGMFGECCVWCMCRSVWSL